MYEGKRVYLSIGALSVVGINGRLKAGYTVVAYEPDEKAFAKYQEIESSNLFIFNKAVSDFNGQTTLYNYTILPQKNFESSREIEVVSLDSVLSPIKKVQTLHLNCEGAEIPIIMGTSLDNFEKCTRIWVEFHKFVSNFNITDEMVQACVERLGQRFHVKDQKTYHPDYVFLGK